jgi:hypothetical protein
VIPGSEPITAAIPPGISDTCPLGTDIGQNFQPITAMERQTLIAGAAGVNSLFHL